jgi:shikimate dehydrogenase/3-dehydroquinate dehydratase type I
VRTCVSVAEKDMESTLHACREAAEKGADMIEVRFDRMAALPEDLSPFRSFDRPLVATLRSTRHGGGFSGPDPVKLSFLKEAARAGFQYIDLELDFQLLTKAQREIKGAKFIISQHDHHKTPSPSIIVQTLVTCDSKGDVAKVAYHATNMEDVLNLVEAATLYSQTGNQFVAISMGERGSLTRACYDRMGAGFTYASLHRERPTAPGQLDLTTLKALEGERVVAGVVGQSLSHSLSSWMHNAAFRSLSLPGLYLKFQMERQELTAFSELVVDLGVRGFNVTIPYKAAIIELLDKVDPEAERIGAVNTVLNNNGQLVGFNTDVYGVEMTFEKAGLAVKGRPVLVLGAGGAARSVLTYLARNEAEVFLYNRTRPKAEELAKTFGGITVVGQEDVPRREYDAVVNCTPLGMKGYPDELPVERSVLRPGMFVMDTIYNPARTRLVAAAEESGAKAVSGRDMLIYQAMRAFSVWTGKMPDYEVMLSGFQEGISR